MAILDSYPELPPAITDRNADVWEPLITVGDVFGGKWPELARVTAVTLVTLSQEDGGGKPWRAIVGGHSRSVRGC